LDLKIARRFMKVPFITLVNLLAKEEVYPEFLTDRDPSKGVAAAVIEFLTDPRRRKYVTDRLDELCAEVAKPGACANAARFILDLARMPAPALVSSAGRT